VARRTRRAKWKLQEQGFLVVRDLVAAGEVDELLGHIAGLGDGSRPRVHMLHRELPIHERFLLHPRILDVVQALVGPDVLALQSMLFLKQPGAPAPLACQPLGHPPAAQLRRPLLQRALLRRQGGRRCATPGRGGQ
jgi:hypothetical protein